MDSCGPPRLGSLQARCLLLGIPVVVVAVNNASLKPGGTNHGKNPNAQGSPARLLKIAEAWCAEEKVPDTQPSLLLSPADKSHGTPLKFLEALRVAARAHLNPAHLKQKVPVVVGHWS